MASADIVMAGFGGQGLMAIGKILAKAAMEEGRNVTWMPSYGFTMFFSPTLAPRCAKLKACGRTLRDTG